MLFDFIKSIFKKSEVYNFTLHSLICNDATEKEILLLLEKNIDVNEKDTGGNFALHYAIEFGRTEIVKLLLEHKADPNVQDAKGVTPFNLAKSFSGLSEIVELLLKYGADPTIKDKFGKTYLM